MFRPRAGHGYHAVDECRVDQTKHRACYSRANSKGRASAVLHRRTATINASARGLPIPFPFPVAMRRPANVSAGTPFHGMPSSARMVAGSRAVARAGKCERGVSRGGGVGAGEVERDHRGTGFVEKGTKKSTFRRLWVEAKHEKGYLTLAGVCLVLSSSTNLMAPTIMAKVIDRASKRGDRVGGSSSSSEICIAGRTVSDKAFFLGALGVFALGSVASWGRVYALAMASAGVADRLRARLFKAMMLQEKGFFDTNKAGELAPVLAEDVDVSSTVFGDRMASILRSLNSAINASVALLSISPSLTLVSISTVPLVGSVAMLYSKHVKRLTVQLKDLDAEGQAFAHARLANVRTVRAFANEMLEAERFQKMVNRTSALRAKQASAKGLFRGGLFAMTGASLMAVFWVGGSRVGDGSMTAGQLTSFAGYTAMVGLGFSGLASGNAEVAKALASAERVFTLLDRVPTVPVNEGIEPTETVVGDLEFCDVRFQYDGRDKAVLQEVNLQLHRGKVLALAGASGAGKSTLASLITRLYEPNVGCIKLDGVDIATLNPSWLRGKVGVVDQEPVLFDGSIADNIRYGVPSAGDEDVENAARQANAHEFIMEFPEGYGTKVGDGGCQLSGGQKQRVAIARAVLKNPPVLILDEATSALDAESERLVSEAIDRVVASRTVLVIAHRQTTVSKADYVAVLHEGRVAEIGTYASLMSKDGGVLVELMEGVQK